MAGSKIFSGIKKLFFPLTWFHRKVLKRTNLTLWIFIFMIIGFFVGWLAPKSFSTSLEPISKVFLYMVKSLITPLIFSTLVVGIAGHGEDLARIGLLALKSILYFEFATTIALIIGLIAVNVVRPGDGISLENISEAGTEEFVKHAEGITLEAELFKIIPDSFFKAAANNEILQIVFCAVMFAVAMVKTKLIYRKPMLEFLESLSQIMFKVTELVMNFAPIGIGCALAFTIGKNGLGVLVNLGKLVATLYVSLIIYVLVVFVPLLLLCRVPMMRTLKCIGKPALIAFSTSSSEAALPIAMENLERFGVPRGIVGFVLPTGYSFNLDGTTLYLALAAVFAAQAGNIDMPISQQIVMMLSLMLSSKGVAAVPRASLVILSGTVTSFNLPLSAVSLIIGVDALMDMGRTAVNLTGNCVAAILMAVWEGSFDYEVARGNKSIDDIVSDKDFDPELGYTREQNGPEVVPSGSLHPELSMQEKYPETHTVLSKQLD